MAIVLITGASGFVAKYLISEVLNDDVNNYVIGVDIANPASIPALWRDRVEFRKINLLEDESVKRLVKETSPEKIFHLASFSSVAKSWESPAFSFNNNLNIFLNILEAVREKKTKTRILSVGSSEEYGDKSFKDIPFTEDSEVKPTSPYGVARVSQEMLSRVYVFGYGLDIVLTRSFNHIGPFQREQFVIPGFIKQFVESERNSKKEFVLKSGNVEVVRDFSDVRDVVKAYSLLMQKGISGQIYNVCSGKGESLVQIIGIIEKYMNMKAILRKDPELFRPMENHVIIGDNSKIKKQCGWDREYTIEQTIADTVDYWREKLRSENNT
jgi:GDP-4-dehydro-6-deoxy-D-mannose reductase